MSITEALASVQSATQKQNLARLQRIESIRSARAAGASLKAIASAANLSITRVHELSQDQ